MILQVVAAGTVVNSILVPDAATIASGGGAANWPGGSYSAPPGAILMAQAGAGIGWTLEGGALVAPVASTPAPTPAQLLAHANARVSALLAASRTYVLASGLGVQSDATTATNTDLLGLNVWGTANPAATMPWVDDFGVVTTITGAEAVALGQAVLAYGQSVYAELAAIATAIAAGTITSTAQIDGAAWPA